jgi:hypothetical protein
MPLQMKEHGAIDILFRVNAEESPPQVGSYDLQLTRSLGAKRLEV